MTKRTVTLTTGVTSRVRNNCAPFAFTSPLLSHVLVMELRAGPIHTVCIICAVKYHSVHLNLVHDTE